MTQVLDALKAAYYNGRLTKARIDQAATRIITLKLERHIMPILPPQDYGFTA
jgi:hypothetical protein